MTRALSTLIAALATAITLICTAAPAHAATVLGDNFNRPDLGPAWITHGGGTLYLDSGQLSAVGTPSEPVSMAFHAAPASSSTQEVSAVIRWNGRNPEHSAMSIALRADPGSQHAGVHFWFTRTYMGIALLDWGGTKFTPAAGTPAYNRIMFPWPDGTRITLRATNTSYAAYVSTMPFMPVLWGTLTTAQVPLTNLYGGVHGQDDSKVAGGGQPPANLDDYTFGPVRAVGVSAPLTPRQHGGQPCVGGRAVLASWNGATS
ncbi:hypothetical protein IU501_34545 [Nocardia otitidiscaviarum]|uniref:hypothetical protein n=1 Tax=Nocardia otitidiscaviarum TaxID=1823 RepID=UPI001893A99B|nr:hypothetical protein [Nocardia otitidiscaviarum]MBF6138090.1 hypothetical protein [Nocardia otitidiscaviarum]